MKYNWYSSRIHEYVVGFEFCLGDIFKTPYWTLGRMGDVTYLYRVTIRLELAMYTVYVTRDIFDARFEDLNTINGTLTKISTPPVKSESADFCVSVSTLR